MLPNAKVARTSDHAPPRRLSPEHEKELTGNAPGESAISQEVIRARGYYTAERPADLPEVFPKWQRRRGLVIPTLSPSGATAVQYKPFKPIPRKGKPGPKYETPKGADITLDVNPLMLQEVCFGNSELWATEGCKKVDAFASWRLPSVGFTGVDMFAVPGTKGTEPLPCWFHVRLKGRTVIVAYDADAKTNASVQRALSRLVPLLESLGATVLVVYVPPVNGDPKAGVDDFKAAGGTAAELRILARPFEPVDIARERLKIGGPFADSIGGLWVRWDSADWPGRGGDTDRAIEKALIRFAEKRGKLAKGGVRVEVSHREIAELAGVSTMAPQRSIPRLEGRGRVRLDNANRERSKSGAFILPISPEEGARYCIHDGRIEGPQRDEKKEKDNVASDFSPLSNAEYGHRVYTSARPLEDVPEFRHPTIRFAQEKDKRGRSVKVGHYVSRPGKRRGAMVEFLARRGGSATVSELMARYASPKARKRDFKRLQLSYLEGWRPNPDRTGDPIRVGPPVVRVDGDTISLVEDWSEAVEIHRELTGEIDTEVLTAAPQKDASVKIIVEEGDETRQRKKHARQREAFRRRDKRQADPEPEMPQVDDMRDSWSVHPNGCACRDCVQRFGRVIGEHVEGCRCAVCFEAFKKAAREKSGRRVVPLQPRKKSEREVDREVPAPVVELRADLSSRDDNVHEPRPATISDRPEIPEASCEGDLSCECLDCSIPTPRYARAYAGSRA